MSKYASRAGIVVTTYLARLCSKMWADRVRKLVQAFCQHIVVARREMLHVPKDGF